MKFRKKPVVVGAWRVPSSQKIYDLLEQLRAMGCECGVYDGHINITTIEGVMRANGGDWIIKGAKGEFYPCKPDIFEATYEPVEGNTLG